MVFSTFATSTRIPFESPYAKERHWIKPAFFTAKLTSFGGLENLLPNWDFLKEIRALETR